MDENTAAHDQALRFGGGGAASSLNTPGMILLAIGIILLLVLPRRYVFVPLVILGLVIPQGQQLVLLGLHFPPLRLLLLFGWARVVIGFQTGSSLKPKLNSLDWVVLGWAVSSAIAFTILWGQWGAVVDRFGFLYNTLGTYFFLRMTLQDRNDFDRFTLVLFWCSLLIAVCMVVEQETGRNLFSLIGGVDEYDMIREGRIRAQGPFAHPILAGVFGAVLVPLFYSLRWRKEDRYPRYAWGGIIVSTVIVVASASSTPIMAFASGILALCLWPLRAQMRFFRWCIALTLIGLHMVMKAPVWALIGRIDLVGGNSADHRYELVNQLIRHIPEWWLVGARNPSSWGYLMGDTSNQFMDVAVTGGMLGLILFIWILVKGFQRVGLAWRAWQGDDVMVGLIWSRGAALFANFAAFWGTAYFDQIIIPWYALLAMIAAVPLTRELGRVQSTQPQTMAGSDLRTAVEDPGFAQDATGLRSGSTLVISPPPRVS